MRTVLQKILHYPDIRYYDRCDPLEDRGPVPSEHYIRIMCRRAGVTPVQPLKAHLYLTREEREFARPFTGAIAIQSSGMSGRNVPMLNKEWGVENFRIVAAALPRQYRVLQIGHANDPPLPGVVDLRGALNLRQVGAVLSACRLFVGLEGLLMHLARAVTCPSVIVFGGREAPVNVGYPENANIARTPPCSPCWRLSTGDFDRRCLREITPAEVIRRALSVLAGGEAAEGISDAPRERHHQTAAGGCPA
jgi:hypothetical protein